MKTVKHNNKREFMVVSDQDCQIVHTFEQAEKEAIRQWGEYNEKDMRPDGEKVKIYQLVAHVEEDVSYLTYKHTA